jgi:hypothetical protein
MGGKQSKQAVTAPVANVDQAPSPPEDDPLAGTPFALKPSSPPPVPSISGAAAPPSPKHVSGVAAEAPVKKSEAGAPGAPRQSASELEPAPRLRLDLEVSRGHNPHYSQVIDPVDTINPITGRSIYYGSRPWRCDDRFQDWLATFFKTRDYQTVRNTWKTFMQCTRSEYGAQPTTPYESLERREIMFYVDRAEHDMIRDRFWQRFPWSVREPALILMNDGTKMRVWRHQREMELEAKEGRVEELIAQANNVATADHLASRKAL